MRFAILLGALLMLAAPVRASIFTIPATADAEAQSNDNFATDISVQPPATLLFVHLSGTLERRAAFEFDISGLPPAGEQVTAASLILYFTEADFLVGMHGATGNGTIEPADFTFSNEITTFDPVSSFPPAQNTVDVTAFIQAAAAQDDFVVFQLRELFNPESNVVISSQSSDTEFHPRLEVVTTVIPEPTSFVCSIIGMTCVGASYRRRRKRLSRV